MSDKEIIATGLQFPEGPVAVGDGSVLVVEIERKTITRILPNGDKEIISRHKGGPNSIAVGPEGALYIPNNGGFLFNRVDDLNRVKPGVPEGYTGGWIERVDPKTGEITALYDSCNGENLLGPNDIVLDGHGGFYFTDFGKIYPRYRPYGGVYYGKCDGSSIVELAYPLITPNGVGLSPDGKTVYAAETETGRLWAFDLEEPGVAKRHPFPSPHGGRLVVGLPGYQRFDSLAVDATGNICVATLVTGCISVISPSGEVLRQVMTDDPITTNICFGGEDLRTAYITLSGTGQLLKMPWPETGLSLEYSQDLRLS